MIKAILSESYFLTHFSLIISADKPSVVTLLSIEDKNYPLTFYLELCVGDSVIGFLIVLSFVGE